MILKPWPGSIVEKPVLVTEAGISGQHICGRAVTPADDFRCPRVTPAERSAFCQKFRLCSRVDGTVHPAAAHKAVVRGIHKLAHWLVMPPVTQILDTTV